MNNLEDFKVLWVSMAAIIISYINTPLDGLRYVVLAATFAYTVRKWYLMEKRNKNDKNDNGGTNS